MIDAPEVIGLACIQYNAFETTIFGRKISMLHLKLKENAQFSAEKIKALVEAVIAATRDDGYEHISIKVPAHATPLPIPLQECNFR